MYTSLATKGTPTTFTGIQRSNNNTPYDATLRYNRIIHKLEGRPEDTIQSIDAIALLDAIEADKVDDLYKITLACKPVRDGVGIWDVLFNSAQRTSLTACILTADHDFKPLGRDRVIVTSNFMNLSKATTRSHLSLVKHDDRVGVGIYDMTQNKVYVLLYEVDSFCQIQDPAMGRDNRPGLSPATNLRLTHVLVVESNGEAAVHDIEEGHDYPRDAAHPFVEHIVSCVYNITEGYAWKPHFLPVTQNGFDRAALEERLEEEVSSAQEVTYDELLDKCRAVYQEKAAIDRANRTPRSATPVQGNMRKRPGAVRRPPADLPVVEVVNTAEWLYVHIDHTQESDDEVVKVAVSDLNKAQASERYLTGQDLAGSLMSENSNILTLPADTFGENAYLRYLTLNF